MNQSRRNGLTLLETVVVTVVTVAVLALVVVGLSLGRERARRSGCQDHLRRLGMAMQSYHQSHGMLPPAVIREDSQTAIVLKNCTSRGASYVLRKTYANWAILLLPHLGEEELTSAFDPSVPVTDPANAKLRMADLAVMKCSSDRYNRVDNAYRVRPQEGAEGNFSRGNYAINAGVNQNTFAPGKPWVPAPSGLTREYLEEGGVVPGLVEHVWGNGVAGINKSFSVQEFKNGLANLVGIDEVRAGLTVDDVRGVWALGAVGASITLGHGLVGDASGPNCRRPRSDDIIGCNQVHEVFGEEAMVLEGMPCASYVLSEQATARSMHPGGVNALMMDGSAKFYSDDMDLSIWHAVHSRETREVTVPACEQLPHAGALPPPPEPAQPLPKDVEWITNAIGMKLVRIPAGEFIMGLPDAGNEQEAPLLNVLPNVCPHPVQITRDFYLSAFEVTQGQFTCLMRSTVKGESFDDSRDETGDRDRLQQAVTNISWTDAVTFCNRLSVLPAEKAAGRCYRLPTEAEWEYACRSGSTQPFSVPQGEEANAMGFNLRPDSAKGLPIGKVGSYPPNALGLYDMRGNAMEWCADWFAWDYYKQSPRLDPQGPPSGVLRVVRGADWRFTGMACHYTRFDSEPWRTSPFIGFRVVCERISK